MSIRPAAPLLTIIIGVLAAALAGSLVSARHDQHPGTPHAHDEPVGTTATPGVNRPAADSGTGVVYLTITNDGDEEDALVGGATVRAREIQVHRTEVDGQVARMRPVGGRLTIPAGESVTLEPGGMHIMLVGLTDDIRLGDAFDVTLTFERAGEVTIPVTAVLDAEDAAGEPVEIGELTIEGAWSRPAPMIGDAPGSPAATPST